MEDKRRLNTWQLVKRMTLSVTHLVPYIALAVFFAVLGFLATLLIPALIIKSGWNATLGKTPALWLLGLLVLLAIFRGLFRYLEHYFGHYVAFHTLAYFRNRIFEKLRTLIPAHLDTQNSGNLLKMIGEDIEAMEVFFAHTLPPVATVAIVTLLLSVYYWIMYPLVAIIAIMTYIGLAIVLPFFFARRLQPLLKQQTDMRNAYMKDFLEILRGMKTLVQFDKANGYFNTLESKSKVVNQVEKEVAKQNTVQALSAFLLIGLSIMCIAAISFQAVLSHKLNVYQATVLIVVFSTSFAPYLELSRLPLGFKRAINAARHVFELLDTKAIERNGEMLEHTIDQIEIKDLTFQYDNREQTIFEQLSCSFEKNKIIGLVGASGSGKSTLMKLIMRWYDTASGAVEINQANIQQLDARSIQNKIAYIPQVPHFFNQTIRENLLLGKKDITDEVVLETAQKCRILDVILATKDGLDTRLNHESISFSAGELQRLELTRALLKNADCYIFDEPTSNLDSLNEASFLQVIKEHCRGYVFLISHRPSTVSCADIIYRVENKQLYEVNYEQIKN